MFWRRDRLLRQVLRERFVVTPKNGPMFTAVLLEVDGRSLRFADVRVQDGEVQRPAQGELFIGRANVAYMQRVTAAEKE